MSVKVLICTCGDTLNDRIDFEEIKSFLTGLGDVSNVITTTAACKKSVKGEILEALSEDSGYKLLALACTRSVCFQPLEDLMKESGLSPDNLVLLNLKEQLAFVHSKLEDVTSKAKMIIKSGLEKVRLAEPKEITTFERYQEALVVGSGISGLTAAGELVDQGFQVHVIEKNPTIGGTMPLISKTHPEEDCTRCLRGPYMIELLTKPGITYHISSKVKDVQKTAKGFKVTIEKSPVKLDFQPRRNLGQPTEVTSLVGGGYQLIYPEGDTGKNLATLMKSSCENCSSVFPAGLMNFDEGRSEQILEVGTVILATGFKNFDPTGIPKWGYGLDNVVTQYQLARMLDPLGPTKGEVLRPAQGTTPNKIVMVQCVGSRDKEYNRYCSKYCCLAAIKHATILKKFKNPGAQITILFRDIRASGYGFEEFFNDTKDIGVDFVHGDLLDVSPIGENLLIGYRNGMGTPMQLEAEMVVLSTGMLPAEGSNELAELFNIETTESGFFKAVDEKVANIVTRNPGVFIAGTCTGPKNIPECIAQSGAAAFMAGSHLQSYVEKKVNHPIVNEGNCGKCGVCRSVCPYGAITIPEGEYPQFDVELCMACGLCVSSCPTRALETPSFGYDLIDAQVNAIIDTRPKDKHLIIGFLCDDCGYNLLDTAGFEDRKYTSSFVPIFVNCMSNLSLRNVLSAVRNGVDGVLLVGCVKERCHFLKGTQRSEGQMQIIEEFFKSTGVKTPIKIIESSGTMVSQFIYTLTQLEKEVQEAERR